MAALIKTYIVVMVLASTTFWVAGKALPDFLSPQEYKRWRNAWFAVMTMACVANNIWIFCVLIFLFCQIILPAASRTRVIYFLLLFSVLPMLAVEIPGAFGVRYFLKLNYPTMLIISILIGLYIKSSGYPRWLSFSSDRFVLLFFLLVSYLSFRDNTFTNGARDCVTVFLQYILPYYVISRYLYDIDQLNKALMALFLGVSPLAAISVFESTWHWHIYDSVAQTLRGRSGGISGYDMRSGELRSSAIYGSPIVLGYVLVIAFGILLYMEPLIKNKTYIKLAGFVVIVGLLSTMARGPWVGLILLYFAYLWTGRGGATKIAGWSLIGFFSLPLLALTEKGKKFIDLLPIIGTERSDTMDYRAELAEKSMIVFKRNPWFGSTTYLDTPEMESMRQGQGIIDIVNSYIQIVLPFGLVGLLLFVLIFYGLLWRCYFILGRIPPEETDLLRMGRVLFATLLSILFMIATVSSIDYAPYFYWFFGAIVAAYINVAEKTIKKKKLPTMR